MKIMFGFWAAMAALTNKARKLRARRRCMWGKTIVKRVKLLKAQYALKRARRFHFLRTDVVVEIKIITTLSVRGLDGQLGAPDHLGFDYGNLIQVNEGIDIGQRAFRGNSREARGRHGNAAIDVGGITEWID